MRTNFKISQFYSSNISLHLCPQLEIIILGLVFGNPSDRWSGLLIPFLEYSCLYSVSEMGLQYSLCILLYSLILWCIRFCFDISEIRMQRKSCHWPGLCQDLMFMVSAGQVWNVPMTTFLSAKVILLYFGSIGYDIVEKVTDSIWDLKSNQTERHCQRTKTLLPSLSFVSASLCLTSSHLYFSLPRCSLKL